MAQTYRGKRQQKIRPYSITTTNTKSQGSEHLKNYHGKILIVDDERTVLVTLKAVLEHEGYSVEGVLTGREAIRKLHSTTYDLVLTDLQLSDISGTEILAEIRRLAKGTVAIVMTSYASLDTAIDAMREGAYDYLIKATEIEELKLRVSRAFERRRINDELELRVHQLEAAKQTIDQMNASLQEQITEATTELREHVDELNRTRNALEEAQRQSAQFISMIVHDLTSPLTPILLAAQLIQMKPEMPEDVRIKIATIIDKSKFLQRLISDLSLATRLQNGTYTLTKAPSDVDGIIRKKINEFREQRPDRQYVMKLDFMPAQIDCDASRIEQTLHNLLDNAVKYSDSGTTITVETKVNRKQHEIWINIIDQGIGIPDDKMEAIFNPYMRVKEKSEVQGMGLGLYITKVIIEAHGGRLEAQSGNNRIHGTTFSLILPYSL